MAFVLKLLKADLTNAGSATGLYTVSSPATAAIVSNIRFVNTTAGSVTLNLYLKPSPSGQYLILDRNKSIAAGDILTYKPELTMALNDVIEATTSAAIEYVVCGMERQ